MKYKELKEENKALKLKIKNEIEEKRTLQTILIQESKMAEMGTMLGAIAHQWKQPLNIVALVIQKLALIHQRGFLKDSDIVETTDKILKQVYFMSNTIDDFRDFFKPNKEKIQFKLSDIIENIVNLLSVQLKNYLIEVRIFKDENLKDDILGYPNEFKQVVLNILNNSKDAIIENIGIDSYIIQYIDITINDNKEFIIIEFQDYAGGIKETIIDKIFDNYFSTKTNNSMGIGLFITKSIIDKMSGTIFVENKINDKIDINNGLDKGALFKIMLKKEI